MTGSIPRYAAEPAEHARDPLVRPASGTAARPAAAHGRRRPPRVEATRTITPTTMSASGHEARPHSVANTIRDEPERRAGAASAEDDAATPPHDEPDGARRVVRSVHAAEPS